MPAQVAEPHAALMAALRGAVERHDASEAAAAAVGSGGGGGGACRQCAALRASGALCALASCCARRAAPPADAAAADDDTAQQQGGGGRKLKRCGSCKAVAYCSAAHQREDWARHKGECGALSCQAAGAADAC
jgi:hypothetical protein